MITLLTNSCSHSSDSGINEDSNDFKLLLEAILDTNHVLTDLPILQSKAKGVLSESLHLKISDESPRFGLLIGQKLKKNADGNNFYEGLGAQLIAEAYTRKRNIDSSEYWINQAEIFFKSDSFQLGIANLDFLKANISIQENRYVDAYNHLNTTLAIYREQGDSGRIIDTSIELAYLFGQLNMFKQSRNIYFQVWDYLKRSKDSKGILVVTNLIAESYYLNYEAGQALIYANQAYDLATKLQDVNQKTFSCNLLGIISLDLKDYSNAIRILKECIVLQSDQELEDLAVSYFNLGKAYALAGETKLAKEAIATSLQKSENSALYLNNMMLCYKLLADINTKETDFEEANKSLRNYYLYKDSLEALHEKSKITELYLSFAESSKEKEIKATKYNENLVRSINRIILIGSAFVVLMLILYLRLLSDRNHRKSAVQEQRLEMAKKEADLNKKLLMEFQLRLSERNATLLTMPLNESDELDQKSIDDLNESETTEDSNPSAGFLENIKILTADDWERFVSLYDIALPGVIGKVHTKFPNLTAGEQRIFLLLKLDVDTREIAAMLGISPESVRKSKYRLRKKLSIPDGMSIENFIKQGI